MADLTRWIDQEISKLKKDMDRLMFRLRQDIAVTGSVNQKGEIQAIGGVNQKIEGFYDCCRRIGLTGRQGIMIPQSNVKDLR